MTTLNRIRLAALVALTLVSSVSAQDVSDATRKFRGAYGTNQSSTYNRHAQDYTRQLYHAPQLQSAAPLPVLQEQATAVRKNTTKASEALKEVTTAFPKDTEAAKLVESIQKHYANVLTHCDMLDDCCKTKDATGKLADCCVDIHHELEAAQSETDKLMKHLKIEPLGAPKKAAAKK
ncbi:MAG: hypothetical protein AABP62_14725 [Planctomycetota bacterium]